MNRRSLDLFIEPLHIGTRPCCSVSRFFCLAVSSFTLLDAPCTTGVRRGDHEASTYIYIEPEQRKQEAAKGGAAAAAPLAALGGDQQVVCCSTTSMLK